jgi:DNA-binding beta-propeller fold protein YncE
MRGTRRIAVAIGLVAALLGAGATFARAAGGDLSFAGCFGNLAGCTSTSNPVTALNSASTAVMTPDGHNLYVGTLSGVISHFSIDAGGNASFAGCLGPSPCVPPSVTGALNNVYALGVNPTGNRLYSASYSSGAVSHIDLDGAGNMTFKNCVGSLAGCTAPSVANALSGPIGLAVSPGGNNLYVSNYNGNDVAHLSINAQGDLTFQNCVGLAPCTATAVAAAISAPWGLVASGSHLYVASSAADDISHFTRNGSGDLAFAGCVGTGTTPGCVAATSALDRPISVAVSPNGQHLYATAQDGGSLSHFTLDGAGNPAFARCIGNPAGCLHGGPAGAFTNTWWTAITPDAANLYTARFSGAHVNHLALDASGNPTFVSCNGNLPGCAPTAPAAAINGPFGLAVAPNGLRLYVAADGAGTLVQFGISPPIVPKGPPPPPPADSDHDGIVDPNDRCPNTHRGQFDKDGNGCPGPYSRLHVSTTGTWSVSDRGVKIGSMSLRGLRKGVKVKLSCRSCHVSQTITAKRSTLSLEKLRRKTLRRGKGFIVTVTVLGSIGDQLTLTVKRFGHKRSDFVRAARAPFKVKHRCLPVGSSKTAKSCSATPPTGP